MKTCAIPVLLAAISLASPAFGEDGKFNIYMGGKPVASETYSIDKSAGKIQIDGSGKAELGPIKVDIQRFRVVTDDKYQLISASAKATMGQVKMEAETTFSGGKATSQVTSGPATAAPTPLAKEDDVHADAIVVNSNLPLFPWSLLAMKVKLDSPEPQQLRAYIIGQSEVPLTVAFLGKEPVEFADRKAELNHLNITLTPPQGQATKLDMWINDDRRIIKVLVPSQGVEAYQEGFARKAPPAETKPEAKP